MSEFKLPPGWQIGMKTPSYRRPVLINVETPLEKRITSLESQIKALVEVLSEQQETVELLSQLLLGEKE